MTHSGAGHNSGCSFEPLNDDELCVQIIVLAGMAFIAWDDDHYRLYDRSTLSSCAAVAEPGFLQAYIEEARRRAEAGSRECRTFMAAVDRLAAKFGGVHEGANADEKKLTNTLFPFIRPEVATAAAVVSDREILQACMDIIEYLKRAEALLPRSVNVANMGSALMGGAPVAQANRLVLH